jgi:hypothetical protein
MGAVAMRVVESFSNLTVSFSHSPAAAVAADSTDIWAAF